MRSVAALLFALVLAAAPAASAEGPTAAEILEKASKAEALGLVNATAELTLVVTDAGGSKTRQLTASALETGDETRRLVRFREPADVRGVAFLVVEKKGAAPERWLYLPAQKRVRRVSGRQGGQSFMATDFAYADLDLAGGAGDESTRLADEKVDGNRCWVVETKPRDASYAKITTFVHQQTAVPLQVLFADETGAIVKKLKVSRVKQVDGRWFAMESVMETPAKGSKTTLTITALDTKAALPASDFTEQALERL